MACTCSTTVGTPSPALSSGTSDSSFEECHPAGLPLLAHLQAWMLKLNQDPNQPLKPRQRLALMAQLNGAKVEVDFDMALSPKKCQHKALGVTRLGANTQAVLFPGHEASSKGLLSVADFFDQAYNITLKYPNLNCVELPGNVYVPIELVRISALPNMKSANMYWSSSSSSSSPGTPSPVPTRGDPVCDGCGKPVTPPTPTGTGTPCNSAKFNLDLRMATGDQWLHRLTKEEEEEEEEEEVIIKLTNTTIGDTNPIDKAGLIDTTIDTTDEEGKELFEAPYSEERNTDPTGAPEPGQVERVNETPVERSYGGPATLHTWGLYSYDGRATTRELSNFVIRLKQAGGVEVHGPVQLRLPQRCHRVWHNPLADLQDLALTYPGLQLVVVVVVADSPMYGRVKVVGDLCLGVVTQCLYLDSVRCQCQAALGNLIDEINAKLGGTHTRMPRLASLPHLAPSLVVMALHHSTTPKSATQGEAVVALVASVNLSTGTHLTEVRTQAAQEVTSASDLTNMTCRLLQCLTGQYERPVPEQILVYSDVGECHMKTHWSAIARACTNFMSSYSPHITFVGVWHSSSPGTTDGTPTTTTTKECQPQPKVTLESQPINNQEFTITISGANNSRHSTHYKVQRDTSASPLWEVEHFTLALCQLPSPHLPQPVPRPLTYARLAALRCHRHIGTLRDNWTQQEYKELDHDIRQLVTVGTHCSIAHHPYYM